MPTASSRRSTVVALELVVAAFGAAGVLGARLFSWSKCWSWSITEGREGPGIYALWRVLRGLPLYEPPLREPYSLTLYNFGFYDAYAFVLRCLGVNDERLLSVPRALSLAGSAVGAVLFVLLGARLARPGKRLEWLALTAIAFVVWFGTQFVSWWAFAVRPDVWAATLALGGLYLVVVALEETRLTRLAAASFVFALAWSFKQSSVWTFAGSLLGVTLLERNVKRSLALLTPFVLVAALSLYLGGPVYRANVLVAPVLGRWEWSLFTGVLMRALPQNPFIFGFWLLVLLWECRVGARDAWARLARAERLLAIVAVTACAFGSLAFGREGSNKNHLLEGYVACALASWCALRRLPPNTPRWLESVAALAVVPLVLLPVLQLAAVVGLVPENRFGRALLCSDTDARAYVALDKLIAALPQPIFADDEVFSQPWHSTGDRYPAIVLDATWYGIARRERLLPDDFPRGVLRERGYRSAVFTIPKPMVEAFAGPGSRCEELAPHPLGFTYVACLLGD